MPYIPTRYSKESSREGKKPSIKTAEDLAAFARSRGFEKEAEKLLAKPKLSLLQRLGRGLMAFEIGNAVYQKRYNDASFVKTYATDVAKGLGSLVTGKDYRAEPKKFFKDIMVVEGMKDRPGKIDLVDVTGLAADILFDPTSWIPAKWIATGISKTAKPVLGVARKTKGVRKVVEGVEEGVKELFQPFATQKKLKEVIRLSPKVDPVTGNTKMVEEVIEGAGEQYVGLVNAYYKGTRFRTDEFGKRIAELSKTAKKEVGKKEYERAAGIIGVAAETKGLKTGNKILDEALEVLTTEQKAFAKELKEKGIINSEIETYMHHMLTPEAMRYVRNGGNLTQFLKPMRIKMDAALQRKYLRFTDEFGKDVVGSYKTLGLKPVTGIKGIVQDLTQGQYKTLKAFEDELAKYGYKMRFVPKSAVKRTFKGYINYHKKEIVIASARSLDSVLATLKHEIAGHGAQFQMGGRLEMIETMMKSKTSTFAKQKAALETTKNAARAEKTKIWKALGIDDIDKLSKHYQDYYKQPTELVAHAVSVAAKDMAKARRMFPKTMKGLDELKKSNPLFNLLDKNFDESMTKLAKGSYIDKAGKFYNSSIAPAKEINDVLEKKLKFRLFEENAFKAFSKSGVESITALETYDFFQRVMKQFGVAKPKKAKVDALGKAVFMDKQGIKWIETNVKQMKGTLVPEAIAAHIDDVYKILTNDEATKSLISFYDKMLRFWKASVTGYFPAFHTRNLLGGLFNNFIAGVKNPMVYKEANDIIRGKKGVIIAKDGTKYTYKEIRKMLQSHGVIGQTGIMDVQEFLKREVDPTVLQRFAKAPQKVMGLTENNLRAPLFIDSLKKGLTPEQAAKRVIKFHFDYMPEGFTAFEKNVMKRIIPFYTWTRHNIPLQIEQMIMQPGKYAGVMKTQRAVGSKPSSEEEAVLPRWLKERFTIKSEGGYWSGIGVPLEEATEKLSDPIRGFGVSMSPFIKVPIEILTGFNIFKNRPISEDTYAKYYRHAPEPMKKFLQLKERTSKSGVKYWTANPKRKYWLEAVGARGLSTMMRVANGVKGEDRKELLSLITTIKRYDYDMADLRRWNDADARKELERVLVEAGEAGELNIFYVR